MSFCFYAEAHFFTMKMEEEKYSDIITRILKKA